MKKFTLILLGVIFITSISHAQYRVNKTKYDYRNYSYQVGDPYNPPIAGVASFLIPGLGQMISGEGGRGAAFLGGYVGCLVIYVSGAASAVTDISEGGTGGGGAGLMTIGLLGAVGVEIWSIVDAVRVAKVNNLAFRDKNNTSYRLQVDPYIQPVSGYAMQQKPAAGISLKLKF